MADWADLPEELLLLIAKCLESRFDLKKFRAVCPTWRASAPSNLRPRLTLCSPLPWKHQSIGMKSFLVKHTTCLFKSPGQTTPRFWLASIAEEQSGKKLLDIPLSWRKLRSEVIYPNVLVLDDISSLQVQELVSEYYIHRIYTHDIRQDELYNDIILDHPMDFHHRAAYLNTDLNGDDDQFTLLLGDADSQGGPLLLLKSGDEEATTIETTSFFDLGAPCGDFIQFKGKFYVVNYSRTTICIEPNSGAISLVSPAAELLESPKFNYLIKWCGKLLLVEIVEHGEFPHNHLVECRVFCLDEEMKKWVPIESLGDGILFLGGLRKFFAPTIHGVQGNCIVFVMDKGNGNAYLFDLSKQETVPLALRPDLYDLLIPPSLRGAIVFKPDLSLRLGVNF